LKSITAVKNAEVTFIPTKGWEKMPIIVSNRNLRPAPTNQYLEASVSKNFYKAITHICNQLAQKNKDK
jgi:hypothetical protein